MDRTVQFQEYAQNLMQKTTNTAITPQDPPLPPPHHQRESLSTFYGACYKIVHNIHKLDCFLKENYPKYISFKPLFSFSKGMSDKERNQIDAEAKNCIEDFRKQMLSLGKLFKAVNDPNEQQLEHCKCLYEYIDDYLWMVENSSKRLRKLQIEFLRNSQENNYLTKIPEGNQKKRRNYEIPVPESTLVEELPPLDEKQSKMLVEENKHLQDRFLVFHEKIGEISQQVSAIQYLTDQMAEHVEMQSESLFSIERQQVEANSNVRSANENLQILKANSKDMRLFLLTLLVFLSFALLFLHWLNP